VDYHLDVLRELGLEVFDDSISISLEQKVFDSLRAKMPGAFAEGRKRVVIHPGAGRELKQWGAGNFARLADMLSGDCGVFVVTGPSEKPLLDDLVGRMRSKPAGASSDLTVHEFAALCELCDMFIGNDSGPMHIASAKTFTVGIFGPTDPDFIGPWCDDKLVFHDSSAYPCKPCMQLRCEHPRFMACLNAISPENVAEEVGKALAGPTSD
jgi:ADP-heptose:LPS heptosyltransferase